MDLPGSASHTSGGSSSNNRRHQGVKKGIDENASRRQREERSVQIRKDKRLDRTNFQRRKVFF